MALTSELTEHTYDAARLRRMVETLHERVTGESVPTDPEVEGVRDPGLAELVGRAGMSTRAALAVVQNLLDFIDGPSAVEAEPARMARGGVIPGGALYHA